MDKIDKRLKKIKEKRDKEGDKENLYNERVKKFKSNLLLLLSYKIERQSDIALYSKLYMIIEQNGEALKDIYKYLEAYPSDVIKINNIIDYYVPETYNILKLFLVDPSEKKAQQIAIIIEDTTILYLETLKRLKEPKNTQLDCSIKVFQKFLSNDIFENYK